MIGGNTLHTPDEINDLVERLLLAGGVFHVTLDPSLDEIMRRFAACGGDKSPGWLVRHVAWMHERNADRARDTPVPVLAAIAYDRSRDERCFLGGTGGGPISRGTRSPAAEFRKRIRLRYPLGDPPPVPARRSSTTPPAQCRAPGQPHLRRDATRWIAR